MLTATYRKPVSSLGWAFLLMCAAMNKEIDPNPWMTRKEAKAYLGVSMRKVDYITIPLDGNPRRVHGRIRSRPLHFPGSRRLMPRLLKADVYALLPRPERSTIDEPKREEHCTHHAILPTVECIEPTLSRSDERAQPLPQCEAATAAPVRKLDTDKSLDRSSTRAGKRSGIIGFRADEDVALLLRQAQAATGATMTYLLQKCVRIGLKDLDSGTSSPFSSRISP